MASRSVVQPFIYEYRQQLLHHFITPFSVLSEATADAVMSRRRRLLRNIISSQTNHSSLHELHATHYTELYNYWHFSLFLVGAAPVYYISRANPLPPTRRLARFFVGRSQETKFFPFRATDSHFFQAGLDIPRYPEGKISDIIVVFCKFL